MNITLEELELVADELAGLLVGGKVQEFRQPSPTAIWFSVRRPGASHSILIETRPGGARMHAVRHRFETLNPPPAFVCKLRHDLTGARIAAIRMPWEDRVVVIELSRGDALHQLVFEASSHHPNLFLTGARGTLILALAPSASHRRSLLPGKPYQPPEGGSGTRPCRISPAHSASAQLEALYATAERDEDLETARGSTLAACRRALKRVLKTIIKVEEDRRRAREFEGAGRLGELLKMNLHLARRGMTSVTAQDFFAKDAPPVEVPLDPALSPVANMERFFAKARKAARGRPVIERRLEELTVRAKALDALFDSLAGAGTRAALDEILTEAAALPALRYVRLGPRPAGSRSRRPAQTHRPYREFTSTTGRTILVGRAGKDDHALTFQHASPHDAWLHMRGFPGSHVVVRLNRGQQLDPETLRDAAHLAVRYSKAPAKGFCEVIWTTRKNVRAVRKGAPGQVLVESENTFSFEFDENHLRKL